MPPAEQWEVPIEKRRGFRKADWFALVVATLLFIVCAVGVVLLGYLDIFETARRATDPAASMTRPCLILSPLAWLLGRTVFRLGAAALGRPAGGLLPPSLVPPLAIALGVGGLAFGIGEVALPRSGPHWVLAFMDLLGAVLFLSYATGKRASLPSE